jgi:toxic protein SymE
MDLRHLKVGYLPVDSRSRASDCTWGRLAPKPHLRLTGRWLDRAGFAVGTAVRVQVERGRLVLEVIESEGTPRVRRLAD